MNRISKTKKVIRALTVVLAIALVLIVVNFLIHAIRTVRYNDEERTLDSYSEGTDVLVDIHPRGLATDSWEKNDAFPGTILKAKIYEATVTNSSSYTLHDWSLRINIQGDCYINNAWNGTVEIHQFIDGEERTQTLSLQNYNESDLTLSYYMCGQDLLIPLSKGDYIIYHPADSDTLNEDEIPSTKELIGEMSVGIIFYSLNDDIDLTNYEMQYYLTKDIWTGVEASIFEIGMSIWILCFIIYMTIQLLTLRYERGLNRQSAITNEFIQIFADYVDVRNKEEKGHSAETAECARRIARKLGMNKEDAENVFYASLLHDIGKCYIPEYILNNQSTLTNEELETYKTHTVKGAEMLKDCKSVAYLVQGAMYHHENYDGSGYPEGRAGEDIPLIGRIISISDCYKSAGEDSLHTAKEVRSKCIEEIKAGSGTLYDPVLVEVMVEILEEVDKENWEID